MSFRRRSEVFYGEPFIRIISKIAAVKGLTLDDLAARAAVPRGCLHRCERGTAEPWITDIFLVAKALEVGPLWLFNKVLVDGNALRSARMRSRARTGAQT